MIATDDAQPLADVPANRTAPLRDIAVFWRSGGAARLP